MPPLSRQPSRTRRKPPATKSPLAELMRDPAVRAADPAVRAWLLGLLRTGESTAQDEPREEGK